MNLQFKDGKWLVDGKEVTDDYPKGPFGVYDNTDHCWIGTEKGPNVYTDFTLARIAAQIIETRLLGSDMHCRFTAELLPDNINKLRDTVATKYSSEQALERIERGG